MVQNCVLVKLDHLSLPLLWSQAGRGLAGELFEIEDKDILCLAVLMKISLQAHADLPKLGDLEQSFLAVGKE